MKILLIHLRILIASKSFQKSLMNFFMIFCIVFFLSFVGAKALVNHLNNRDPSIQKQLIEVFEQKRVFNQAPLVEFDQLPNSIIQNQQVDTSNFWEASALEYRYTVPQKGVPF